VEKERVSTIEWLPLALVLTAGFAVLLARYPIAASLGLYALLLPFDSVLLAGQIGSIHLHVTWLAAALATVAILSVGTVERRFIPPPRPALYLSLLVAWSVVTAIWAINPDASVFRLPLIVLLLALYLAASSLHLSEKELAIVTLMAVLGGCAAAALSLQGFAHGEWWSTRALTELGDGRETLVAGNRFTNPNTLAATLILPLSLTLGGLFSRQRLRARLLLFGVVALLAASLLATMSRGALAGVLAVLLVFFARMRVRKQLIAVVGLFALVTAAMPGYFFFRLGNSFADRGAGRLDIWLVGWNAFKHYSLLGAGLDCFPDAYTRFMQTGRSYVGVFRAPHNTLLGTAVELGVVGAVLLIAAIVAHFKFSARLARLPIGHTARIRVVACEAALWGLLVCALFLDMLWEEYFWLTLMLLIVATRVALRERARTQPVRVPQRTAAYRLGLAAPGMPLERNF